MKHKFAIVLATAACLAGVTSVPAVAAGAEHAFLFEDYNAYEHFGAGESACVTWPGTLHEVRSGGYQLVAPPGGQQEGEFHVNGVIDGRVELIPDDAMLPTYAGTYREKVDGVVTAFTEEGDVSRVAQYRLRSTLYGTDGTALDLRLSGKFTMNANGEVVVSRDVFSCG